MGAKKKSFVKQCVAWLLVIAMVFTNVQITPAAETVDGVIEIATAEELAKIGADANYPMTGDYVLTADIDLSEMQWTPMGGYVGTKGTMDAAEANVFSGTFDGQGHVISGLTIDLDGSIAGENLYGQVGLFSVIAGSSAEDYAVVKNLIFTDVDITTDFSDGLAAIGTLAGDVNGYSIIDQVVVLDGNIVANPSGLCDTVGVGGLIGECRTGDTTVGNSNISITDCYNGAMITASGTMDLVYAGGIIGRVAKSACKEIKRCVNVAIVQYDGYNGYAISAAELSNEAYLSTMTNCYYDKEYEALTIGDGATGLSTKKLTNGELPEGLIAEVSSNITPDITPDTYKSIWTAQEGCYVVPTICYESSIADVLYLKAFSLDKLSFAEEESAEAFKTSVELPAMIGEVVVTWSSSNEKVISIADGVATAHSNAIGEDTIIELIATTENGNSQSYKVTVISSIAQAASFDAPYAKVGTPLSVVVDTGDETAAYEYTWTVDGVTISNTESSYTPTEADLESFITVHVQQVDSDLSWDLSTYFSELPVVYIDTADGSTIDSNIAYEDGTVKVQGNDEFPNAGKVWYDGAAELKGRGNSTWSESVAKGVKRPYKIKLDKKADLLGLSEGNKNKHWALLANMIDHTNMRNELVTEFSDAIGMTYMNTTGVVVILNGEFEGTYELCEHKRIDEGRIDVFDWEGLAGDIAEAIAATDETIDEDDLVDAMETDFSWIDGTFVFDGRTLTISDYWDEEIPEFTGGFFLDMDFRSTNSSYAYKYISPFLTQNGIPMFIDGPEYAITSDKMMNYAKTYMDAYESALMSDTHTTTYNDEIVHYSDLFDMDSLVQYWLVCEYTNNWDSMKNSTLVYKDLDSKAYMGPVWDYDWAWGNINMYSMTGPFVYDNWHTTLTGISTGNGGFRESSYQQMQWNRFLVKDPYFVTKAYELYKEARAGILEDTIKEGGRIDTLEEKYETAALKNDERWSYSYNKYNGYAFSNGEQIYTTSQTYHDAVESLKTFITKRVAWLDEQFTSVENLYASLGNSVSSNISIGSVDTNATGTNTVTVAVGNSDVAAVELIVNGEKVDNSTYYLDENLSVNVAFSDKLLETEEGAMNTLQVVALDADGAYISGETNFINFTKEVTPTVTGTVTIEGTAKEGEILKAVLSDYETTENLSFQWYADGVAIEGVAKEKLLLENAQVGAAITVKVTSSIEEGEIVSEATAAVAEADVLEVGEEKLGLLINHVYGGGAAGDTPISHDFVELYNNSTQPIDLTGYSIGYYSNRDADKAGSTVDELGNAVIEKTELTGTIASGESFLIRGAANATSTYADSVLLPYAVDTYDMDWTDAEGNARVIDNKQFQIILYNANGKVLDGVSVGESTSNTNISKMVRFDKGVTSKQKSLRREGFGNFYARTWYNSGEDVVMITTEDKLNAVKPHGIADGLWAGTPDQDPAEEPETDPTVAITGTAKVGEILSTLTDGYVGTALSYQWYADAKEISGATKAALVVTEDMVGKVIYVTVTSDLSESATSAATEEVVEEDEKIVGTVKTGLLINHIYGGGGKSETPISHDFIELYNNSNEDIALDGIIVKYLSNRENGEGGSTNGETVELALSGTLEAKKSYLIRGAVNEPATSETVGYEDTTLLPYMVDSYDVEWTGRIIDNKQYQVIVCDTEGTVLDALSVGEDDTVNADITDMVRALPGTISKQKSFRRHEFGDYYDVTWFNSDYDLVMLLTEKQLEAVKPHTMADGYWAGAPTLASYVFTEDDMNDLVIEDTSGNGYDATLNGVGATIANGILTLPGGSAASTSDVNSPAYVEMPGEIFEGRDTLTISVWLKNQTGANNYAAMSFGTRTYSAGNGSTNMPMNYWLLNPKSPAGYFKSVWTNSNNSSAPYDTETATSNTITSVGDWNLYTTVITADRIIGYYNGIETVGGNNAKTKTTTDFGTDLVSYIGRSGYADMFYKGGVYGVKIYDKALTRQEIWNEYYNNVPYGVDADALASAAVAADMETVDLGALTAVTENLTLPTIGENGSTISWKSSHPEILANDGTINRPEEADAACTLTAVFKAGNITDTKLYTVTVRRTNVAVEGIETADALTVEKGETANLYVTITPEDATDKTLTFESDNEEVAVVSEDGVITAKAVGTANITVTTGNGLTAICKVTVVSEEEAKAEALAELEAKLTEVKEVVSGLAEADYTADSWVALQDAITAAEEMLTNEEAVAAEVRVARVDLEYAFDGLELDVENIAPAATAAASYTNPYSGGTAAQMNDGALGTAATDSNWNSWSPNEEVYPMEVSLTWTEARRMSSMRVMWWADGGGVMFPGSASLEYLAEDGTTWVELADVGVEGGGYNGDNDIWNTVDFGEIITTTALRMLITSTSDNTGVGIGEWEVYGFDVEEDPEEAKAEALAELEEKLAEVKATVSELTEADYTAESWTALQTAIADAEEMLTNEEAVAAEVRAARVALEDAFKALEEVQVEPENPIAEVIYTFDSEDGTGSIGEASAITTGLTSYTGDVEYVTGITGAENDKAVKTGDYGIELSEKNLGSEYTISFWVKADGTIALNSPVVNIGYHNPEKWLAISGSNGINYCKVWTRDAEALDSWITVGNMTIPTEWSHICMTQSGRTLKIYQNGKQVVYNNVSEILDNENGGFYLGVNNWDEEFNGCFDEVAVYNTCLTEEEVVTLYEEMNVTLEGRAEAVESLLAQLTTVKEAMTALTESEYTPESWSTLQDMVVAAEVAAEDKSLTVIEIVSAEQSLVEAFEGLTTIEDAMDGVRTALEETIAEAEAKIETDYTAESWQQLQEVIAKAKEVLEAETSEYTDITSATHAVETVMDAMVFVKILDLDFDGEFAEGVTAHGAYEFQSQNDTDKVLYLDGIDGYLDVKATDGSSLLAGREAITVSYDAKPTADGSGWVFYAAANDESQTPKYEQYVGILNTPNSLIIERYNNDGYRPSSFNITGTFSDWIHVDIVIDEGMTSVYLNGNLSFSQTSSHNLKDIVGANGILQIGKANWYTWTDGEFYSGLLDNIAVYPGALTSEQIGREYLVTLVKDASGYNENDYTAESYASLQSAITNANIVLENAEASMEEVSDAGSALQTAVKALVITEEAERQNAVDILTEALESVKAAMEEMTEEDYTETTWSALQKALEAAESTLADETVENTAILEAAEALKEAYSALEFVILLDLDFEEEPKDSVYYGDAFSAELHGAYSFEVTDEGNQALVFDGNSTYLDVKNARGGSLIGDKECITISYDAKVTSDEDGWAVFAAPDTYDIVERNGSYLGIEHGAGVMRLHQFKDGVTKVFASFTGSKEWAHVDVVMDGDTTKVYFDERLCQTITGNATISEILEGKGILQVGKANQATDEYFTGALDNLVIYNGVVPEIELIAGPLEELIEFAHVYNKADYTEATWSVLEQALEAAEQVLANAEATSTDVEAAKEALWDAIDNLQTLAEAAEEAAKAEAVEAINVKITEIEEALAGLVEAEYTVESWSAVDTALVAAKEVAGSKTSLSTEVTAAQEALEKAYASLKTKEEEARELALEAILAKIAEVEEMLSGLVEEEYTVESWSAVEEALTAAKAVAEEAEASSIKISNANTVLIKAVEDLKTKEQAAKEAEAAAKAEAVEAITAKITEIEEALAGLVEADYTEECWSAVEKALAAAKAAAGSETSLSKEVAAVQSALEEAYADLKTKEQAAKEAEAAAKAEAVEAITAKIAEIEEALNGKVEADYTEESWSAVEKALAAAKAVAGSETSLSTEVAAAQSALEEAYADLKTKEQAEKEEAERIEAEAKEEAVEKITEKVEEIEEALDVLDEDMYTESSWKALEAAIIAAKAAAESKTSLSTEVTAAQSALEEAYASLKTLAEAEEERAREEAVENLTKELVKTRESLLELNEEDYTEESWNALQTAIEKADAILTDATAKSEDVITTNEELAEALKKLKTKADAEEEAAKAEAVTALTAEIAKANEKLASLDKKLYTDDSWQAVLDAIESAEKLLKDEGATSTEINDEKAKLIDAVEHLQTLEEETEEQKKEEALKNLQGSITAAKSMLDGEIASDYTAETWNALQAAIAAAEAMLTNVTATSAEVDAVRVALDTAMDELEFYEALVTAIQFEEKSYKIAAGKKVNLNPTVLPEDADDPELEWSSSKSAYASVNDEGVVVTKMAGAGKTVTITAKAVDGSGVRASVKIKIMKHAVKKISLKAAKTVNAGKKVKVKATVTTTGSNANKKLIWKSSNEAWATVKNGVVKTTKAGKGKKVTITAVSTDGTNKKAKVRIKIK